MHSDQLTERLEFIRYYASNSPAAQLNSGHLETLWDQLLTKSPVEHDKKQLYQWLREICDDLSRAL